MKKLDEVNLKKMDKLFLIVQVAKRGAVALAICNQIPLRDKLLLDLQNRCNQANIFIYELVMDKDHRFLISMLRDAQASDEFLQISNHYSNVVFSVTGIEYALPDALKNLNLMRDYFYDLKYPVILWINTSVYEKIIQEALDFWHIRSITLEFKPLHEEVEYTIEEWSMLPHFYKDVKDLNRGIRIHKNLLHGLDKSKERDKKMILNSLYELGNLYSNKGEYANALKYYQEGLTLSENIGDQQYTARFFHGIATIHLFKGEYDEALNIYTQSLKTFKKLGDHLGEARTLHQIATIHRHKGMYDEALNIYTQSLKTFKKLGDKQGIAYTLQGIALIHRNKGEYAEALNIYTQSLKTFKELGDKQGIAYTLQGIALIHRIKGEYVDALDKCNQSLKINKKIGNKKGISMTLHSIAMIHKDMGEYAEAITKFYESLEIKKEIGDQRGMAITHYQLGNLFVLTKKYKEALHNFIIAKSIFEKLDYPYLNVVIEEINNLKKEIGE
ncbi:MAG: tetratricopeptide repeat protein [Methanosarcinales archaeon]